MVPSLQLVVTIHGGRPLFSRGQSLYLLPWPSSCGPLQNGILLSADAGFLSGFSGIESVPGPQLLQIDFLSRFTEDNQKKYVKNDARFKESLLLKQLLEKYKLNKEKNRQETLDKCCVRGAEWGGGDCSAAAMSPEDRESFVSMLREKKNEMRGGVLFLGRKAAYCFEFRIKIVAAAEDKK